MRTLAFDGQTGASGDMLLGALLAAGADRSRLTSVEAALDVAYEVESVTRTGIRATAVDVVTADDQADAHGHLEGGGPHRHYPEVIEIVEGLDLAPSVEARALAICERLGEAEATVHGTDLHETHFHEVGADDAIADVVGVCLLVEDLGVEHVVTTPVAAGAGTVEMSHGTYPVPVPAVVEIAAGAEWSLRGGPEEVELLTPTGAAILAELAEGVDHVPALTLEATGYGAGDRQFDHRPNVLRALVGEGEGGLRREEITVLETAVDDVSPEVLGGLQETLTAVGARDVAIAPLTMKKSRPGHLITVVCLPGDAERVAERLAAETGTLGVRERGVSHRWVADRRLETVSIELDGEIYEIGVKVGTTDDGTRFDCSAEFDDALRVARATDRPIRTVQRLAERAFRDDH